MKPAAAPQWLVELTTAKKQRAEQGDVVRHNVAPSAYDNGHSRYVETAIQDECAKVAQCVRGSRNETLNAAAFSLGQLVGGGVADEAAVQTALEQAAAACGLTADDGQAAVLRTIRSGFEKGSCNLVTFRRRSSAERTPGGVGRALLVSLKWTPHNGKHLFRLMTSTYHLPLWQHCLTCLRIFAAHWRRNCKFPWNYPSLWRLPSLRLQRKGVLKLWYGRDTKSSFHYICFAF